MKRTNTLFLTAMIATMSIFFISSLGWAQTQGPYTPQQSWLKANQRVTQTQPPRLRDQARFADMRIDWNKLGLSEEQKEEIRKERRNFQLETAGIRTELSFAQQDLQVEMMKATVDRSRIDSILNDISTLTLQLSEAAVQNLLAIKATLTLDQLDKLQELQSQIPAEFERLRLTPEQRAQIQNIVKSSTSELRSVTERLQELKAQLRETLLTQNVDFEELNRLQTEIAEVELAQREVRVDMLLQVKEILTPEQFKLWQRTRAQRERNTPAQTRNG